MAAVIRDAIDRGLPNPDDKRRAAARRVLEAEPVDVPDVPELLTESQHDHARRPRSSAGAFADLLAPLLPVTLSELQAGLHLSGGERPPRCVRRRARGRPDEASVDELLSR